MTVQSEPASTGTSGSLQLSEEDRSKDKFFHEVAELSNSMIAAHGSEFAMGTLVLAARFIAEGKALTKKAEDAACCGGEHHTHNNQT